MSKYVAESLNDVPQRRYRRECCLRNVSPTARSHVSFGDDNRLPICLLAGLLRVKIKVNLPCSKCAVRNGQLREYGYECVQQRGRHPVGTIVETPS